MYESSARTQKGPGDPGASGSITESANATANCTRQYPDINTVFQRDAINPSDEKKRGVQLSLILTPQQKHDLCMYLTTLENLEESEQTRRQKLMEGVKGKDVEL